MTGNFQEEGDNAEGVTATGTPPAPSSTTDSVGTVESESTSEPVVEEPTSTPDAAVQPQVGDSDTSPVAGNGDSAGEEDSDESESQEEEVIPGVITLLSEAISKYLSGEFSRAQLYDFGLAVTQQMIIGNWFGGVELPDADLPPEMYASWLNDQISSGEKNWLAKLLFHASSSIAWSSATGSHDKRVPVVAAIILGVLASAIEAGVASGAYDLETREFDFGSLDKALMELIPQAIENGVAVDGLTLILQNAIIGIANAGVLPGFISNQLKGFVANGMVQSVVSQAVLSYATNFGIELVPDKGDGAEHSTEDESAELANAGEEIASADVTPDADVPITEEELAVGEQAAVEQAVDLAITMSDGGVEPTGGSVPQGSGVVITNSAQISATTAIALR